MTVTDIDKAVKKIENDTKKAMQNVGVWKDEFRTNVVRYASVLWEYQLLRSRWVEAGCPMVGERRQANGIETESVDPTYKQIQKLRAELQTIETQLGLNPAGLKRIKDTELKSQKGVSRFEAGLSELQEQFK